MTQASKGPCATITPSDKARVKLVRRLAAAKEILPESFGQGHRFEPGNRTSGTWESASLESIALVIFDPGDAGAKALHRSRCFRTNFSAFRRVAGRGLAS